MYVSRNFLSIPQYCEIPVGIFPQHGSHLKGSSLILYHQCIFDPLAVGKGEVKRWRQERNRVERRRGKEERDGREEAKHIQLVNVPPTYSPSEQRMYIRT